MTSAVSLALFLLFSFRSVRDDIRSSRVRVLEICAGISALLTVKAVFDRNAIPETITGGAIGAFVLSFVQRVSKGRLGSGDVWYSAFIGCAFGFWTWNLGLICAAILGIFWACALGFSGKHGAISELRIPFTPFMFAGALGAALFRGFST